MRRDGVSVTVHIQRGLGFGSVEAGSVRDCDQQIYPPDVGSVDEVAMNSARLTAW